LLLKHVENPSKTLKILLKLNADHHWCHNDVSKMHRYY